MVCSVRFHSGPGVGCSWRHSWEMWKKMGKGSHYSWHTLENCSHVCSRLKPLSFLRYLGYCNKRSQRAWLRQQTVILIVWEMEKFKVICLQIFKRIYLVFNYAYVWEWECTRSADVHRDQRLLDPKCCPI